MAPDLGGWSIQGGRPAEARSLSSHCVSVAVLGSPTRSPRDTRITHSLVR